MTTIESGRPGTALVLGATGGVGGEAARQLRDAGWGIRALARGLATETAQRDGMTWLRGDAMNRQDVARAALGCEVIVHAVNPPGYRRWGELVLPMIDNTIAVASAQGATIVLPGTIYNYCLLYTSRAGRENGGGLGHLHHEGRASARQVVGGADAGEDAVLSLIHICISSAAASLCRSTLCTSRVQSPSLSLGRRAKGPLSICHSPFSRQIRRDSTSSRRASFLTAAMVTGGLKFGMAWRISSGFFCQ